MNFQPPCSASGRHREIQTRGRVSDPRGRYPTAWRDCSVVNRDKKNTHQAAADGWNGWGPRWYVLHAPNDIVIFELLEQRYLADGGARYALVLRLQSDLLERDDLVRADVTRLVHDAVGACCGCMWVRACDNQTPERHPSAALALDNDVQGNAQKNAPSPVKRSVSTEWSRMRGRRQEEEKKKHERTNFLYLGIAARRSKDCHRERGIMG